MKLNDIQQNVLSAIVESTVKTRGKNAGERKALINAEATYDNRVLLALLRRGLIEYKFNTVHGEGYGATAEGYNHYTATKAKK